MDCRSTGSSALVIALTVCAPAWGQVAQSSVPAPLTLQQEQGSQLVPAAQPPFEPRSAAVPPGASPAQTPSRPLESVAAGVDSSGVTQDGPASELKQERKPREAQTPRDSAAAALNRQELSRITTGGGVYRIYGY